MSDHITEKGTTLAWLDRWQAFCFGVMTGILIAVVVIAVTVRLK